MINAETVARVSSGQNCNEMQQSKATSAFPKVSLGLMVGTLETGTILENLVFRHLNFWRLLCAASIRAGPKRRV